MSDQVTEVKDDYVFIKVESNIVMGIPTPQWKTVYTQDAFLEIEKQFKELMEGKKLFVTFENCKEKNITDLTDLVVGLVDKIAIEEPGRFVFTIKCFIRKSPILKECIEAGIPLRAKWLIECDREDDKFRGVHRIIPDSIKMSNYIMVTRR